MREIKFRAWDNQRKEFLSGGQILIAVKSGRNPKENPQYLDVIKDASMYKARFELMQYTGFKDKNGREIYEGDIVQRVNDTPISFPDGSKKYMSWMVNFNYGGWRFEVTPCSPVISYPAFYSNAQDMEIIGNIYENPELLGAMASGK